MDNFNKSSNRVLVEGLLYIESENILISVLSDGSREVVPVTDNFNIKKL